MVFLVIFTMVFVLLILIFGAVVVWRDFIFTVFEEEAALAGSFFYGIFSYDIWCSVRIGSLLRRCRVLP
jgi:hypothetical protein